MGVIRGKLVDPYGIRGWVSTNGIVAGDWPLIERNGKWVHCETGEECEEVSLEEALARAELFISSN